MTLEEAYKEGYEDAIRNNSNTLDDIQEDWEQSQTSIYLFVNCLATLHKQSKNNPIYIDDLNTSIIGMGAL